MKAGTKFQVDAVYDNSQAEEPDEPVEESAALVMFGEQTTNEMCFGFSGGSPGVVRPSGGAAHAAVGDGAGAGTEQEVRRRCGSSADSQAHPRRDAAVFRSDSMPVNMELKRVIINEIHDQHVIVLREVEGERAFPIMIGFFEVTSINRRVKGEQSPRPLTHDLLTAIIDNLGGELQDIYINELAEHTYFAKLRIRKDGELVGD